MSVGIVGLGYDGLPLAIEFARAEENVIGVDIDAHKIEGLRQSRSHIEDVPDDAPREVDGRIRYMDLGGSTRELGVATIQQL